MKDKIFTGLESTIAVVIALIVGIFIGIPIGAHFAAPVTKHYNVYNTPGHVLKLDSIRKHYEENP